jgi:3-hydroxyacyl-CoA dehydrogenase
MGQSTDTERIGIAGGGAIATGLARVAAPVADTVVWTRSDAGAERVSGKLNGDGTVTTDLDALAGCSFVVEAIAEDLDHKSDLLKRLGGLVGAEAILASTTSSLSVQALADATGRPDRFAALHVFNPVHKMKLVELAFPATASDETRTRVLAVCELLDKTVVEVPDIPGFVVNRLLFPFTFDAVELMVEQDLTPQAVDDCMRLGAGHPMGPLALLDFVGLDVSIAIGESIGADIPDRLRELAAEGKLGRKAGAGFYDY